MIVPVSHAVMTWWTWMAALFSGLTFGFFEAPDGAAADGSAASAEASDAGEGAGDAGTADADPAATEVERAAGTTADDDDPDDEDADLPEEVRNNPSRLRTRLRRTQRQLAEYRPFADRLRGPDGKFQNVDDLLYKAREFDQLDAQLRGNPHLRQTLLGEQPAAADAGDAAFDPSTLPFETDSPEGKYFASLAETTHRQQQTITKLTARLDAMEQGTQAASVAQHESTWRAATLAAANEIEDRGVRRLFITAMYHGGFDKAKREGTLGRIDVKAVIQRQLAELRVTQSTKNRAAAAASQRVAEANKSQPRAARGSSTPAPAQKPAAANANVRVSDVSRSFLKRHT